MSNHANLNATNQTENGERGSMRRFGSCDTGGGYIGGSAAEGARQVQARGEVQRQVQAVRKI